ncbi:TIGR02285 family protein [Halobacteriovorax sp. GB3]|uniref:TIGR02285 family protein n=1 Tax=Halobacteriovorax sp. GB3 TaxID=2719615 RepID=UPI002362E1FE|nr:TIGR02285 family protein [Halobacteriovorax sp. GB3]MDD0851484.1 TIGR02285 family protein [Halobacteriovorax sp. GB3]
MMKVLLLVLIVLSLSFSSSSDEGKKDVIIWYQYHMPPFMVLEGPDQNRGIFDGVVTTLQKKLKYYEHRNLRMSIQRFFRTISNHNNICSALTLKTPDREKYIYFSRPYSILLPNRIIIKKSTHRMLGNPKSISIRSLLLDPTFSTIVQEGRTYKMPLNRILRRHESGGNFKRMNVEMEILFDMFERGRINYLIEYASVAKYYLKKKFEKDYVFLPIEEMPKYYQAVIGCSKTEKGKRIIDQINTIIEKTETEKVFRNSMKRWLSEKEKKEIERIAVDIKLNSPSK